MKITFVLASGFNLSGGDRAIAIHAQRLQERGHEVFVVSRSRRKPDLRDQLRSLVRGRGWLPRVAREPSHFDNIDVPHRVLDAYRPVTDADVPDADAVIATWWETAEWVERLAPSKGLKFYFVQHHETFDYLPKARVEATYRLPLRKIVVAPWLMRLLEARYGDKNAALVMYGVDPKQFLAEPRGRQPLPTVGLMYASASFKACDVSLAAFRKAAERIPRLRLVAFGSEPLLADLPLPEGARYFYQPPQSALRDIYAQCDVWLCGSRSEGFHLPPLEAMACRCPVVSTRVGGPEDIVEPGVNGYLVSVDDVGGLAEHLIRVLSLSEDQWRTMSDAAHSTSQRYTWDAAADAFETALHAGLDTCKHREMVRHASSY